MRYTHECGETYDVPEEFLGKRADCPACRKSFDVPAWDVSKPLTNPGLCSAIDRVYRSPGRALELKAALQGLTRSRLLVATVAPVRPGTKAPAPGSRVQVLNLPPESEIIQGRDKADAPYLAAFTDWDEVAAFRRNATDEPGWTGLLVSWEVLEGVMSRRDDYASLVVNPGGMRILSLPRDVVPLLRVDLDAAFEKLEAAADRFPPLPPEPEAKASSYRHSCGAETVLEPVDAGATSTCKGCGENFQAPVPAERGAAGALQRALRRLCEQPEARGASREFFRLLRDSELVVACELQVPNGFMVSPGREVGEANLPGGTRVLFSRRTDEAGQRLLMAFTDWQRWEEAGKNGGRRMPSMRMPARAALNATSRGDFDALLLDHASGWTFCVAKEAATRLLAGELPPE